MPVMGGIKATEKIRKIPNPKPPKIIAVTAFESNEQREKCKNSGFDDFKNKPVDSSTFTNIILKAQSQL